MGPISDTLTIPIWQGAILNKQDVWWNINSGMKNNKTPMEKKVLAATLAMSSN